MKSKLSIKESFVKRLNGLMDEQNIGQSLQDRAKVLADLCDVSVPAARKYLGESETLPDINKIMLISDHFRVTVSYLIGEIDVKNITNNFDAEIIGDGFIKPVDETVFKGDLEKGDLAYCTKLGSNDRDQFNGNIYILQADDNYFFRRLYFDGNKLTAVYEKKGRTKKDIYEDKQVIEIFLNSVIGIVKKRIKETI